MKLILVINPLRVLILWFAVLLSAASSARGDDRVNINGYVFDQAYTSINGVITIPYNESDRHVDFHTIANPSREKQAGVQVAWNRRVLPAWAR